MSAQELSTVSRAPVIESCNYFGTNVKPAWAPCAFTMESLSTEITKILAVTADSVQDVNGVAFL